MNASPMLRSGLVSILGSVLRELELLIVPLLCAGCDAYDVELCERCLEQLQGDVREVGIDSVRIYCGAPFIENARNVIARWKDHGRFGLCDRMEQVAHVMGQRLAIKIWQEDQRNATILQDVRASTNPNLSVVLVPLPSEKRATRARGFEPATVIASGIASGMTGMPNVGAVAVVNALRVMSKKQDQSELSRTQRRENLRGRILCDPKFGARLDAADVVILIDDVVTTGASFMECAKALRQCTRTPLTAFALLATPSTKPIAEKLLFVNKHEFQK